MEAFSFSGAGSIGKFLPSMNWGISWEGLEKLDIWKDYVKKVQVEHAYNSKYSEAVQITDEGRAILNQKIDYGFSPLVSVTMNFNEKEIDGRLTATFRWNSTSGYILNSAARSTIQTQSTDEISANASYVMNGFQFKFLGIDLKNDLEFSFLFSYKKNRRATFDITDDTSLKDNAGRTLDGNTTIVIEPRARYTMSQRITASAFIRYEGNFNEGAAQPGFNTTQVGLDIRMSISGGR